MSTSHAVGAAAPGDADAGDVRDQKLGDRLRFEIGRHVTVPLRVADTGSDRVAQGFGQRRVDLGEIGAGNAELTD
jgi:hypothetical protein